MKWIKQITVLSVLALFFLACMGDPEPEKLIPSDKMIDILSEIHLVEAKVSRMSLNGFDSASVVFHYFQKEVWKKYGVDSTQYEESYEFYAKIPKSFGMMYERVEARIKEMEDEAVEGEMETHN